MSREGVESGGGEGRLRRGEVEGGVVREVGEGCVEMMGGSC